MTATHPSRPQPAPQAAFGLGARALALLAMIAIGVLDGAAPAHAQKDESKVLRVCADPNNLPLSNRAREGYENKIAELFAAELGWGIEYTWFPQRMGFIRNTLRAKQENTDRFKCDLVIGVPTGFELASVTKPYYRSTYALVYVKGRGLDSVKEPEDLLRLDPAKLGSLRFGVFGQTPPADWLLRHGLMDQVVPYQRQSGDPEQYPGEIVERDLVAGKVDIAFVWGPIAGYFGRKVTTVEVAVVPFRPDPTIRFDYDIAMGVRFGERDWKAEVEQFIERDRSKIQAILAAYGVPLLDERGDFVRPGAVAVASAPTERPYTYADGKVDMQTYAGWRLFQANCSNCHGPGAQGTNLAPDLLPRVKDMSRSRFVSAVLLRYKQLMPSGEVEGESGARAALIEAIVQRRNGEVPMPAWDGDPNVKPHIADLYSWLRARADGVLDDRRPEPMR